MATLTHVSREWRNRPKHERFYDVADLIPTLERKQKLERSVLVPMDELNVIAQDDDLYLKVPRVPNLVKLNNWSMQGLADQIDMNVRDEKNFPADLVAPRINYKLRNAAGVAAVPDELAPDDEIASLYGEELAEAKTDSKSKQVNILMAPGDGGLVARSINGATYGRYRDLDLANDAMVAVEAGWRTPRAMAVDNDERNRIATKEDEMKCSLVKAGMKIGPAGVYYGDRNLFIFLASDLEVLPGHFRFVTLENSEVGENRKLKATFGLMNYVCMNHILWGVSNVHSVEKKHRRGSVGLFHEEFTEALDLVTRAEAVPEALYHAAKQRELGTTKEDTVRAAYEFGRKKNIPSLTLGVCERAWDAAEANPGDADGATPNTYWGFVQGASRYSQAIPYADRRVAIDSAVGLLLDEVKLEDAAVSVNVPAVIDAELVSSAKPTKKAKAKS